MPKDVRARRHVVVLRNTFDNLGDIAMLECEIEALLQNLPTVRLTILSDDSRLKKRYPQLTWGPSDIVLSSSLSGRALAAGRSSASMLPSPLRRVASCGISAASHRHRRRSLDRFLLAAQQLAAGQTPPRMPASQDEFLRTLHSAHIVVGGGSLIGANPAVSDPRRTVYHALRILNVPYVLHGLSLTDTWDDDNPYRGAALVVVRDHRHSRRQALRLGVAEDRLMEVIDPAFAIRPAPVADTAELYRRFGLEPGRFLALNLRPGPDACFLPLLEHLSVSLPSIVHELGATGVLLFGMQSYRDCDDGPTLHALRNRLASRFPVPVWASANQAGLLKGVLAGALGVLSCRYHGAVFGLSSAVPTVGIETSREYGVKLSGLFEWYGYPQFCVPAQQFAQTSAHWVREWRNRSAQIRSRLREINVCLLTQVQRPYERIRELIERAPQ
jgi:polysaccharide pyruvyl transferase WcaK-like protein